MRLIADYLEAEGEMTNPLAGMGADFIYVAFDTAFLPQGEESSARGKIEDALDQALRVAASGRSLGGAYGRRHAYMDLLIVDGAASLEIVKKVLREQGLSRPGTTINFFAKEKLGSRVIPSCG